MIDLVYCKYFSIVLERNDRLLIVLIGRGREINMCLECANASKSNHNNNANVVCMLFPWAYPK